MRLRHQRRSSGGESPSPGSSGDTIDVALSLRLRVRLTRGGLDRQIAAGRPCDATPARSLRARQLADPGTRRQIARDLRGVIEFADRCGSHTLITPVVIDRRAVRAGREAIVGLAERLEGATPVRAEGVALARCLLTDGASPLFHRGCGQTVAEAVWAVADALGTDPPTVELQTLAA